MRDQALFPCVLASLVFRARRNGYVYQLQACGRLRDPRGGDAGDGGVHPREQSVGGERGSEGALPHALPHGDAGV